MLPTGGVAVLAGGVAVVAGGVAAVAGGVAGAPGVELWPAVPAAPEPVLLPAGALWATTQLAQHTTTASKSDFLIDISPSVSLSFQFRLVKDRHGRNPSNAVVGRIRAVGSHQSRRESAECFQQNVPKPRNRYGQEDIRPSFKKSRQSRVVQVVLKLRFLFHNLHSPSKC